MERYTSAVKTYVLIGNYGVENWGDEALREYFETQYRLVQWKTVSAAPEAEFPRLPLGFRSLFTPWWRTLQAIRGSDGVVFGGGTLFTDTESVFACVLWWWHAQIAFLFKKPVFLAFQGVGPFKTALGERLARSVFTKSAFVSVRDKQSYQRVMTWDMNKKVVHSFDPVLKLLSRYQNSESAKNVFAIIPRVNPTESFWRRISEHVKKKSSKAARIISMQPDDPAEITVIGTIHDQLQGQVDVRLVRTTADLCDALADVSAVLTQRYHGAVAALAMDIPFETLPQAGDDKLAAIVSISRAEAEQKMLAGEEALRRALSE